MPQQETYFEHMAGERRVEVLKTYDRSYAREVFGSMDENARAYLWSSLGIDENNDAADVPSLPWTIPRAKTFYGKSCWVPLVKMATSCPFL
jgi:hypothetical protein